MIQYPTTTTLNIIRAARPCEEGWTKLLKGLGKTAADDEPLPLLTILDINGLDDALWCIDADPALDRLKRHYQAWCAEQVLHLFEAERPSDRRVREQIAMLRNDDATPGQRDAARDAASAAARDAARDAAWSAVGDAARDAARAAAWAAASATTWDATMAAAWDAASAAARAAASATAWDATMAAARAKQERHLRSMLMEVTQAPCLKAGMKMEGVLQ